MRSEPVCKGAWTWRAMRGSPAMSSSRPSLQSIGSMELRRSRSTARLAQDQPHQVHQAQAAAGFAAPAAQVDAAQHYLAVPRRQRAHLFHSLRGRHAAAAPAHERDDAERAAVVAAVLDFQVGAGAVARGIFDRGGEEFALGEDIAHVDIAVVRGRGDQLGDAGLVRVAHHPLHAGQRGNLFRRALRVAAGDQNAGGGVLAMDAPHGMAHVLIGRGGNRAGIQDNKVRFDPRAGLHHAPGGKLVFQRGPVCLRGTAPEVLYEEFPHLAIIINGGRDSIRNYA